MGQALRVAAEVAAPDERAGLLTEAVELLSASPAGYELACALAALATELGDAELLAQAVATARECGADGLVASLGGAPTGAAAQGGVGTPAAPAGGAVREDGLTDEQFRMAELAVRDDPAARSRDLSPLYRKLGTDRSGLAEALEVFARSSR